MCSTAPTARAAIDGAYFASLINFSDPNAATKTMLSALKKYDNGFTGISDLGLYSGYLSADLMIFGLQHAGANPTQASFIKNLRQVSDYTAEEFFLHRRRSSISDTAEMFSKSTCSYFVQLKGSKFVVANGGKPFCQGKLLKVPASALSS